MHLGVTDQTYYRWRKVYDGMRVDKAKRLKEFEAENAALEGAVASGAAKAALQISINHGSGIKGDPVKRRAWRTLRPSRLRSRLDD